MARSLWPLSSGATSGATAERSVDRSRSMHASTCASEADHTAFNARGRPFAGRCTVRLIQNAPRKRPGTVCVSPMQTTVLPKE